MPEQNTPKPIKREDIRKGDHIRASYDFTAEYDLGALESNRFTYELLNRPVLLPTDTGYYLDRFYEMWSFESNGMHRLGANIWHTRQEAEGFAPFERVAQITETARQVLADVRNIFGPGALLLQEVDTIATKYGVTS